MFARSHSMTLCLVAAALVTALSLCWWLPAPTLGDEAMPLLADASVNKDWHLARESGVMLYMGDADEQTPQLALNREAFGGRSLQMTIESNVNSVRLSSGECELTLSAPSERRMTLTLDNVSDPPRLVLDHEPLAEQQGRWVRMIQHESDNRIVVSFLGATYANVQLGGERPVAPPFDLAPVVEPLVVADGGAIPVVAPVSPDPAEVQAEAPDPAAALEDDRESALGVPLFTPIAGDFPALRIPADRPPAATITAVRRLQRNVYNRTDGGTGVLTEQVKIGTRGVGPLRYPIFKTVTRPNPEGPHGLNPHRRQLVAMFEAVAREVARIDRVNEKTPEVLADAGRVLSDFTENNWTGLEIALNAASRNALHNPRAQLGQPVVAVGTLLAKNPIASSPAGSWAVQLSEKTEHLVAVDAVLFNATPGQKVLVGGVLAGFVNDPQLGLTPVLQNVVLITPDHAAAEARLKRLQGV